jgi:hypothetical protein
LAALSSGQYAATPAEVRPSIRGSTSSVISSATSTRCHTLTWSSEPLKLPVKDPAYFARPIASGPVARQAAVVGEDAVCCRRPLTNSCSWPVAAS